MIEKSIPVLLMLISSISQAGSFGVNVQAPKVAEEPQQCVQMQGNWEGECISSQVSGPIPAKVQIFQDYCFEIAYYDPTNPIPQKYKINSESNSIGGLYGKSFGNSTKYSEWSKDGRSFQNKRFSTHSSTILGRTSSFQAEEQIIFTLKDQKLEIKFSATLVSTDPEGQTTQAGNSTCTYSRTN